MRRRSETLLGLEDDVCLPTRAARCRESAQRRGVNAVGVQYCTDTGHLDGGPVLSVQLKKQWMEPLLDPDDPGGDPPSRLPSIH